MREFFRSFAESFITSLDLQARALGVSRRRVVAINLWFWLFLLSLVLLPCGARAQVASLCGPGKDCKVKSLQSTTARSKFPACAAIRYGVQIVDGDAGVLRICQADGGWEAVGSGSGDSLWRDGGSGNIYVDEPVRNPAGLKFRVNRLRVGGPSTADTDQGQGVGSTSSENAPDQYGISMALNAPIDWYYGATLYGALHSYTNFTLRQSGGRFIHERSESGATGGAAAQAGSIIAGGALELSTDTVPQFNATADARMEFRNSGITAATASSTVPAFAHRVVNGLDAGDRLWVACHGAGCTYDFAVNYDAPAEAFLGLSIGPTGEAAAITSSTRGTIVNPGSCAANTTTDTAVTMGGTVSATSECVAGVPGVALQAGLMVSCHHDAAGVVFRCANSTGGGLTPPAGTYSCRCFSP